MLSKNQKKQLDKFLQLLPGNNMTSISDIASQMDIPTSDCEYLFQILSDKNFVEIVGKPDYIQITANGRNFRLESSFFSERNKINSMLYNVYLGSSLRHSDRIIRSINNDELDKVVKAFHEGLENIFINGIKYNLSNLNKIKIFQSILNEEYDDYLNTMNQKQQIQHNQYDEVIFYPEDLLYFGSEVTKDYIKFNYGQLNTSNRGNQNFTLDIFISHSHKDKDIAKMVADLMSKAFNLPNNRIRCTSAAGYKFKGGTRTLETIRNEVENSKLLLVLISENSIKSDYVVFEMGARWGLDLPLIPLFYNENGASLLPQPLSNIIGLIMSDSSDMHQLINDVHEFIDITQQPANVFNQYIDEIVKFSATK